MILVGYARAKRTLTYEELAVDMGYHPSCKHTLQRSLGLVYYYCKEYDLPQLTSIVVSSISGLPMWNSGFKASMVPRMHRTVFDYHWYNLDRPQHQKLRNLRTKLGEEEAEEE
jgi:hypothetical protein